MTIEVKIHISGNDMAEMAEEFHKLRALFRAEMVFDVTGSFDSPGAIMHGTTAHAATETAFEEAGTVKPEPKPKKKRKAKKKAEPAPEPEIKYEDLREQLNTIAAKGPLERTAVVGLIKEFAESGRLADVDPGDFAALSAKAEAY